MNHSGLTEHPLNSQRGRWYRGHQGLKGGQSQAKSPVESILRACCIPQSCPALCDPVDVPARLCCRWHWSGCQALCQGIFPAQAWKLCLYVSCTAAGFFTASASWKPQKASGSRSKTKSGRGTCPARRLGTRYSGIRSLF